MPLRITLLLCCSVLLSACLVNNKTTDTKETLVQKIDLEIYKSALKMEYPDTYLEDEVDEKPRFPGCEEIVDIDEKEQCATFKFLRTYYRSLLYPAQAREDGTQGTVIASYIVGTDGYLREIKILQDIGKGCGDSVKRSLLQLNDLPERWIPGKKEAIAVNTMVIVPIKFKLEG